MDGQISEGEGMIFDDSLPKLKILSIDWDYFIDASADERAWMFPDGGNENLPPSLQSVIWANHYGQFPQPTTATECQEAIQNNYKNLEEIDVRYDEIYKLAQVIYSIEKPPMIYVAESHKEIASVFAQHWNSGQYSSVKIVNIDFHSDMYDNDPEYINCGNWFFHIISRIGKVNPFAQNAEHRYNEYLWVHNPDSSLTEGYDIPTFIAPYVELQNGIDPELLKDEYDVIFICKSSMWSPPHLDELLINALTPLKDEHMAYEFDDDVLINRMDNVRKEIEANKDAYRRMQEAIIQNEGGILDGQSTSKNN